MGHSMFLGVQTQDGKPHWTTDCTDCGKCEERCPQSIPVRTVFEHVQKDLEGPLVKMIAVGGRTVLNRGKKDEERDS